MPEIGEHLNAPALELSRLRVLVLVDQVLVDAQVHQTVDLGLLPGLAERGQILAGVAVEKEFVPDGLKRLGRPHLSGRKTTRGQAGPEVTIRVQRVEQAGILLVQRHGGTSVGWSQLP